jgi:predicted amidohydrolase
MALSFADSDFTTPGAYREYLLEKTPLPAENGAAGLIVLPSMTALFLAYLFGDLGDVGSLDEAVRTFLNLPQSWHDKLQALHQHIARDINSWLVPGTTLTRKTDGIYHEALLLSPEGEMLGHQRQTFLSRQEKQWGLSRGEDLQVFSAGSMKVGIIIGTDGWYPETGRILALQGAELVCHCGALLAGNNRWLQLSGMWQQVQQNQFFCVESQFSGIIAGVDFSGVSQILAPCEMTAEFTGVLAREKVPGDGVETLLDPQVRLGVIDRYPLLKLLNPPAYSLLSVSGGDK